MSDRRYTDLTSLNAFPSSTVYPTKDEDGNPLETEYGLSVYKDHQTFTIQVCLLCIYVYNNPGLVCRGLGVLVNFLQAKISLLKYYIILQPGRVDTWSRSSHSEHL